MRRRVLRNGVRCIDEPPRYSIEGGETTKKWVTVLIIDQFRENAINLPPPGPVKTETPLAWGFGLLFEAAYAVVSNRLRN
jgi:hypothetical protein